MLAKHEGTKVSYEVKLFLSKLTLDDGEKGMGQTWVWRVQNIYGHTNSSSMMVRGSPLHQFISRVPLRSFICMDVGILHTALPRVGAVWKEAHM